MAIMNFDTSTVADVGYDALPPGNYNVMITESSTAAPSTNPNGEMVKLTLTVLDGQFANRKVFISFNTRNSNPTAERIGKGLFKQIVLALGFTAIQDTQQLHGIPFVAGLKLEKQAPDSPYEPRNQLSKAFPVGQAPAPVAAQPVMQPMMQPVQAVAQPVMQQPVQAVPMQQPVQQVAQPAGQQPWAQAPQQPWAQAPQEQVAQVAAAATAQPVQQAPAQPVQQPVHPTQTAAPPWAGA